MRLDTPDDWAVGTIVGEAAGEPFEGKLAVASVIRNRMHFKYNTTGDLLETVLRPAQFSLWDDRARLLVARLPDDDPAVADARRAWLQSEYGSNVEDAVLYFNPRVANPGWAIRVRFVKLIENHVFYEDPINDDKKGRS